MEVGMKVTKILYAREEHHATNFTHKREMMEVSLEEAKELIGYKFFTLKNASRDVVSIAVEMTQITEKELKEYMLRLLPEAVGDSALLGYDFEGSPEDLLDLLESYFQPRQIQ